MTRERGLITPALASGNVRYGFFDHDGTLAFNGTTLFEGHEAFIGHLPMAVITGQSAATYFPILSQIPLLDRHVTMLGLDNGGTVYDREQRRVLWRTTFGEDALERTVQAIANGGLIDAVTFSPEALSSRLAIYCADEGITDRYATKHADGTADVFMMNGSNWSDHAMRANPAMLTLRSVAAAATADVLFADIPHHVYGSGVQFMPPGSNKGTAMELMADHMNVDLTYVVAGGNGDNDLDMVSNTLLAAGYFLGTDPVGDKLPEWVTRVQNQSDLGALILQSMA